MSNSGRREGKGKPEQVPAAPGRASNVWESETTTTGSMPTGWDAESTISGPAPVGWDDQTSANDAPPGWEVGQEAADVPPDWEADRTVEKPSGSGQPSLEPQARRSRPKPPLPERTSESTIVGPPADFKLSPGKRKSGRPPAADGDWIPRPPIEVEVRKANPAAVTRRPPPAYEIWTKNRVYALDTQLVCVDVIDLSTGQSDVRHPFMGGQLVGGQRRGDQSSELTFPLPTPGSEAVFQTLDPGGRPRLVVTSRVTRVMLHVQVVKVSPEQSDVTWDTLATTRRGG